MHMRVFSLMFTMFAVGVLLSACTHSTVAPTAQTNAIKTLSGEQAQITKDLLAIKDLRAGMSSQGADGAQYEIANEYYAASGATCKHAIIRHNAPVTITGYAPDAPAKTLHACYKGDTAFLPEPKLKSRQTKQGL